MKNKNGSIVFWLTLFLLTAISAFFVVFPVVKVFYDFGLVKKEYLYLISIGISFASSLGITIYIFKGVKNEKRSYVRNLLYMESPKLYLLCVFLIVFVSSVDSKVVLPRAEAKNAIDISWTIFSISTTIFLVWNVIIVPYLKKHEPIEKNNALLPDEYTYIVKKGHFYVSTNRMYSSIVLLSVNLFMLAFSTIFLYAYDFEISLLTQFMIKATLFLSINSIISLFLNILIPIYEEKKELLKHKRVNSTDIDFQNGFNRRLSNAEEIIDELEKNSKLDNEMKVEIMKTLLKGIIDFDSNHDDSV